MVSCLIKTYFINFINEEKNPRFTEPFQERTSGFYNNKSNNIKKDINENNILSGIDNSDVLEEGDISEGDAGSNFLNSFENDNNYFDKNKLAMGDISNHEQPQKNLHNFPRESVQRFYSILKSINYVIIFVEIH